MVAKKKTTKKKAAGKAVARRKTTEVTNWRDELARRARAESEDIPARTGNTITLTRTGQFRFQGGDLGEEITVVIAAHAFRNKYYDSEYDPDNPTPPACFAVGTKEATMAPHDTSPDKQSEVCDGCWANEFKTAKNKKGKACQNKYGLAVAHPENLSEESDLLFVEVPPTSLGEFDKYVTKLNRAADVPSWAVLTRIFFDEHADWQALKFEMVEEIPDNLLGACMSLNEQGLQALLEPIDVSTYKKPAGAKRAKTQKKTGKKTGKKKAASRRAPAKKGATKKRSRFSG